MVQLAIELSVHSAKGDETEALIKRIAQYWLQQHRLDYLEESLYVSVVDRPASKVSAIVDADYTQVDDAFKFIASLWCSQQTSVPNQPRLKVCTPDAYFREATSKHRFRLKSLSLGIFARQSLFHCEHEITTDSRNMYGYDGLMDGYSICSDMESLFEHDRSRLSVRFFHATSSAGFKVNVKYESIYGLVVDLSERKNKLFIEVKSPPFAYQALSVENSRRRRAYFDPHRVTSGYVTYCKHWQRVLTLADCPQQTLASARVLCLEFGIVGSFFELFELIGRLKLRCKILANFGRVQIQNLPVDYAAFHALTFTSFDATYAFQALLSRGLQFVGELSRSNTRQQFYDLVSHHYQRHPGATVWALERLLCAVDDPRKCSLPVLQSFDTWWRDAYENKYHCSAPNVYQCIRARKVIVTPSRLIFLAPEVLMSNRVLRQYGEENFLRVIFREDDMGKMGFPQGEGIGRDRTKGYAYELMTSTVERTLLGGIMIGNRHYRYLGSSNSQMRDHGCYLMADFISKRMGAHITVEVVRHWMGHFENFRVVSKLMARMGQCFTQAQKSLDLAYHEYATDNDIMTISRRYTFSDGIGFMSHKMAERIAKSYNPPISPVPSAFQVRFAGYKGMLTVLPPGKESIVIFRESMYKFESDDKQLEVVKYSMPSPVYLNRPLIMILDQVSEKQGNGVHKKIWDRVHELAENDIFNITQMLYDESAAMEALLVSTQTKIGFKDLQKRGFTFTHEPFFRSLLIAIHQAAIVYRLSKLRIEVPRCLGRTMFGVMDDFGVLEYGEVFVQYSRNQAGGPKIILEGVIMVTKNPCVVSGDIRLFNAVYRPELDHLVDVIVFPQKGPRPHPDEMAGSDLDGDEYAVFWDEKLMFRRNEWAMDRPSLKADEFYGQIDVQSDFLNFSFFTEDRLQKYDLFKQFAFDTMMVNFFIENIKLDDIGQISNAHLAQADREGIESEICYKIALKHSQQVDFPKSGVPPEPLEMSERPHKYPDYFCKRDKVSYFSTRLIGVIHRRFDSMQEVLDLSQDHLDKSLKIDEDLILSSNEYRDCAFDAEEQYKKYSERLQALMDAYGILDEGALISGHLTDLRNRISNKEKEDFSFMNTEKVIAIQYKDIKNEFRNGFFKEFGGLDRYFTLDQHGQKVLNTRVDLGPLIKKAKAWYTAAYVTERNGTRMFSFPWLVWEVLSQAKAKISPAAGICNPIETIFAAAVNEKRRILDSHANRLARSDKLLFRYIFTYEGNMVVRFSFKKTPNLDLGLVCAVVCLWTEAHVPSLRGKQSKLAKLIINFGVQQGNINWLTPFGATTSTRATFKGRQAHYVLSFLQYLSSQKFRSSGDRIELNDAFPGDVWHGNAEQWLECSQEALKTLHRVALTFSFDALGLGDTDQSGAWDFTEMQTMAIELKPETNLENIEDFLEERTGVYSIRMRRPMVDERNQADVRQNRSKLVLVCATGTHRTLRLLKDIILREFYQLR